MWLVVQKFLDLILLRLHCWKTQSTLFYFSPSVVYHMCVFPVPASKKKLIFFFPRFLAEKKISILFLIFLGGKTKQWCLCRWLLTDEVTPFSSSLSDLVSLLCVVVVSSLCLWKKLNLWKPCQVVLFCLGFCQSAQTNKQPQVFLFLVVTRSF